MHRLSLICIMLALTTQNALISGQTDSSNVKGETWSDESGADVTTLQFTLGKDKWTNADSFRVIVIGDSIAWGCGLSKNEKYNYLVADWLQKKLKRPVEVTVLAHTGATLSKPAKIKKDKHNFLDPELGSWDPTLLEQVDHIPDPNDVDLVLVSGGINDVEIGTILWPFDNSNDISFRCANIGDSMYALLLKLINKCKKSTIIVTSYYPIVSKDTPKAAISDFANMIWKYDTDLKEKYGFNTLNNLFQDNTLKSIIINSNTFNEKSKGSIGDRKDGAVYKANIYSLAHLGKERFAFAAVDFPSNRSYGTSESWLWKIINAEKGGLTDDHRYADRVSLCKIHQCNWDDRIEAIAHPNVNGSREYAHAIESIIESKGLEWLDNMPPIVRSFRVESPIWPVGDSIKFYYNISDNSGSGLKRVELWRTQKKDKWSENLENPIQIIVLAGENDIISGSFMDSPSAPGKYWYGLHVIDNNDNWNDEKNSNTFNPSVSLRPVEVEVKEENDKISKKLVAVSSDATDPASSTLPAPRMQWSKTFGGLENDIAWSVQQTSDGGYIIAGETSSYRVGDCDIWLIKTDASGNEVWNKTFGGFEEDSARSVQQTIEGGYIIAGKTSFYGADDAWLIKTDASGNEVWNKTFGGSDHDKSYSVQQTSDQGYIIVGYTLSNGGIESDADIWLIKTDELGNEIWNNSFGGSYWDFGNVVQQTIDGGYIIAGKKGQASYLQGDAWVIKTDESGNEVWNRTFTGPYYDEAHSVQQTSDGGYIIACEKGEQLGAEGNAWLIKIDATGDEVWNKTFGSACTVGFGGEAYSVQQTINGGYIIAASSYPAGKYGSSRNVWLIKTDASGNEIWNETFSGPCEGDASSYSVNQTRDGGYIVAGAIDNCGEVVSSALLIKIAADG